MRLLEMSWVPPRFDHVFWIRFQNACVCLSYLFWTSLPLLSRCALNQINNRSVILSCRLGHADLTGNIGRVITTVFVLIDFSRFFLRGGGSQFGEEQSAVSGKATAAEIQWHRRRFCTLSCNR